MLDVSPTTLHFDWFYLTVFPLYLWPMAQVWALLAACTVLLALVPWLPPRWRRAKVGNFQMNVDDETTSHPVRPGETSCSRRVCAPDSTCPTNAAMAPAACACAPSTTGGSTMAATRKVR